MYQERSKGKDVRTSNIVAAKVNLSFQNSNDSRALVSSSLIIGDWILTIPGNITIIFSRLLPMLSELHLDLEEWTSCCSLKMEKS